MQRLSAPILVSVLVLAACPADSNNTTTSASEGSTTGTASTGPSSATGTGTGTPTTDTTAASDPTTGEPTTGEPTSTTGVEGTTTTGVEGTTTTGGTTTDGTTTDGTTTDGTTTDGTTGGDAVCGDGMMGGDEACDDSNLKTELSTSKNLPLMYDAKACIDDCSLVLSLCGNGKVDPGEQCDDGNPDTYDGCTTSCTINTKDYGSPCKRMCNQNCDTDVASGTFTGCDNMEVPAGAKAVCYVSTKFNLAPRYFAEGACATTAQTCSGGILCPPNIGNYDMLKVCPEGSTLVDRTTVKVVTVKTKVCQQTCDSDADCRWNAWDTVWAKPGQYRCQTTPDSGGVKICADAQN
jgi:cysteine-rich repeat protein